jgi:uncharacterized protein YwgA
MNRIIGFFTFPLLLFDALGEIKGRRKIHRIVAEVKDNYGIPFPFEFQGFFYGPYSEQLQDVLDILISAKLLKEESGVFSLTEEGIKFVEDIKGRTDKSILEKFKRVSEELK